MADNVVKIEFEADDTSTTAAFSRLNSEVSNLGGAGLGKAQSAMADWRKETGLAEQATVTHGKAIVELGGHAGRTAADFKPATAEMRAASVAVEEVGKKAGGATSGVGAFRGTMRALRFDIFEVVAALGLMAKAVDEAGKDEASQRHLINQGISSGAGLASAAKGENFEPHQYDDAAISLKVAGVAANDLVGDITELGKASRISGVPFEKLVDTATAITDELESGGIPTLSQMTTLTLASSGATQGLTDQYRALEKTLKLTEQAWKVQEEAQARSHKKTEEHTSVVNSMAEKMGVAQKVFQEFQGDTRIGGQSLSTAGTGNFAEARQGKAVLDEYKEGYKQIQTEQGYTRMQMDEYIKAGTIGYKDLIDGSQRYRAHQQEELSFTQKQRDEQLRLSTEAKERALGLAALQSVMSPSDWKNKQADLQKLSPEGVSQQIQAQMTGAMVELGKAITKWFPEIKIAMMFLAGVEIASRLAAINARFAPGLFGGGKTGGAAGAAAEGETAAAGGAAIKPPLWLAPIAYAEMTAEQNAMNAKDPGYSGANKAIGSAVGGWWDKLTGKKSAETASVQAPGSPPTQGGSNGPTTVEDPKMHELIGQLLKVFATGS